MVSIDELKLRMRRLRAARKLTQQEFAASAGLDYKFYQHLESPRKKQVWLETVDRIARTYGIETWQLLHPDYQRHAEAVKKRKGRERVSRT